MMMSILGWLLTLLDGPLFDVQMDCSQRPPHRAEAAPEAVLNRQPSELVHRSSPTCS